MVTEDMVERSVHLSILSEVWEKKENPEHQAKLEELLELQKRRDNLLRRLCHPFYILAKRFTMI